MPHPTDHLQAEFMHSRQEAGRVLDLITLMSNPSLGGECRVALPKSSRALDASGLTAREALLMPPGIVANSALARAGASLLMLTAAQQYEVQLSSVDMSKVGGWGTSADVSPSTPPHIAKPRLLMAHITTSITLWKTAPILAAALFEAQLHAAIGAAIDKAALVGPGGSEPLGLFTNPAISAIVGTPTLANIAAQEKSIGEAFCETSPIGMIVAPSTRETMRTTFENGTGSTSVWNALSDMNRQTSPHAPADGAVVGDFSQIVVTTWGDVYLQVNPYTLTSTGQVRVLIEVTADIQILRDGAFGTIAPAP